MLSLRTFVLAAISVGAVANAAPRVVVQPLSSSVPVPGMANSALLTALARLAIELPSTFEVDDALSSVPGRSCGHDVTCLAGLARATQCGWALAVTMRAGDAPVLSAIVVSAEGVALRKNELPLSQVPVSEEVWLSSFQSLMTGLALETLGSVSADPVVVAPPPVEVKEVKEVQPPVVVLQQPAKNEPKPSWRAPVAVGTGLVAVGAGAAAATLSFINLSEARALEASRTSDGLIPSASVDRAVSLDERTVAATALGIGAGVAALATLTVLLLPDSAPVQVVPAANAQGGAVFLRGQLP